jgi:hypothetical protein
MFARKVTARLKPKSLSQFTNLMEHKILPWLRTQEGFLDLITLAAPGGAEVTTITFWDRQADADSYQRSGYPEVVELLEKLLDGCPYVKTFDVVGSTFQPTSSARTSEAEHLHARSGEDPFDTRPGLDV